MPRYLISRVFDELDQHELDELGTRSRQIIDHDYPEITWEHSHVVTDGAGNLRSFCIYDAPNVLVCDAACFTTAAEKNIINFVRDGQTAGAIGIGAAFLMEVVLTFFLVFVVFGTAIDPRAPRVGGLFIGLAVTMGVLVGGPISGGAMNPARFLGPAIVNASQLQYTWLYVIGGLLGGVLAGAVWRYAFRTTRAAAAAA